MDIAAISAQTASVSSAASADQGELVQNYDQFLQILTAQLRNQSPLEPMDANAFTEQLVQFSSVEQAIKTNDSLESLIALSASNEATSLVGYLGKSITAAGAATSLQGGQATWSLDAASAAAETQVTIRNAAGTIVYSDEGTLDAGQTSYVWDGTTNDATIAPDGLYSITVEARDSAGDLVNVSTEISGVVSGVDFKTFPSALLVGETRVPITSLTAVELNQ
ncbi:MAG: flagellar hook assembly protein FlgD [Hyphomicrobiales bacterium]